MWPGKSLFLCNQQTQFYSNLLLGSKGVDLPRISQKLDSISSKRAFEPVEVADDIDLDTFLKNEIQNCLFSLIEEEHEKVSISLFL